MKYRILKIVRSDFSIYLVQSRRWFFWGMLGTFHTETDARNWLKLRIRGLDREVVYQTGDGL
jgi:hypothetical protein